MRRPNRPYREPNEYDYQNYIWKDLAERILKKDEHTAGDTTVNELAVELESDFDTKHSEEAYEAAEKWLKGFDDVLVHGSVDLGDDAKSTLVLSILGSNLIGVLTAELEVETERLTIEQQRNAVLCVREYTKILMWLGANMDQLKKDVPSVE